MFFAGVGGTPQELRTAGGRVLDVTGRGADLAEARDRAMRAVEAVSWPGMQHRSDIALAAASGPEA
ncbi:MAG: phosphoribosylglycinamide synthetase C domain-containing protein [Microthrixaceae bacterium]